MRVLIVGINYRPELTAVGPYTAGLAEHLAARGDAVTVITGVPHYPEWRRPPGSPRLWAREHMGGVDVIRAPHYIPPRQSAMRRALYEGTFGLSALMAATVQRRPDVVVGVVPSLSGGLVARLAAARFRRPYGILFQDLMGPAASQSGVPGGGRVARVTSRAERWAVRRAAAVAVVADAFRSYLEGLGVPPARIMSTPNWSRAATSTMTDAQVRLQFGWTDDRQVVLHAGNIGYKQGLEQVVAAARLAAQRDEPVRFVLSGGGNQADAIKALAAGLPNMEFLGVQPDGVHASLMAAAGVLLLSERPSQQEMSLPSKLTSYFQVGRPIVAAVAEDGPSATEVTRSGAGVVVPAGRPEALLDALAQLRGDPARTAQLGGAGAAYAAANTSAAACLTRAASFVDMVAAA